MLDLERLWAGWRLAYVEKADKQQRDGRCVFCELAKATDDREALIIARGELVYAALNLFPYNTGHLMVLPYRHVGDLEALTHEEGVEVLGITRRAVRALRAAFSPQGFNVGLNLGRGAGAGIPDHLHVHLVPRWSGDTNYMVVVGGTKVMPEDLPDTWRKLRAAYEEARDE